MLIRSFNPYSPAFGQKQPLKLDFADPRLIVRQVRQGKLNLDEVKLAIEAEQKTDIDNIRKGMIQGLKQMLGI